MTELLMKLSIALFFGLLIGIDRQLKHKPLGLKTSMVICVASCLVTIVSVESFHRFATPMFNNMDPMRLAAQIVSGVGFLGAGVILRKRNDVISGLTTAAMIWAASGLGIAVGAGFYIEAGYMVVLLMLAINVFPQLVKKVGPSSLRQRDVAVKMVMEPNMRMTELIQSIERKTSMAKKGSDIRIRHLKLKDLENGNQQVELILSAPEKQYTTEIYYLIKKIDHVLTVDVEHL
ncbi:MgtC/SapB family protein [Halalkalibacterium halodurans]|jgi:putative Mg2+ transporter-C (MgtC) family protein|uniref:Magnesium (Mg2+) transporter n=1 Tax=Halalkalibacterium halodurans (strain ATCC BAA-125 / DSM 18197 / FERM 7344 / JCM 9153 / C-125) TaxID=272558 RepID=Q9K7Y2_HALH5|nr:MgtC/SapB family protein [Halalkalibacterium halodurans]MDY7223759.1 MgtC/SapB family protein [Halalkalibacterium halodurans]MDY7242980.1 MgtC/SapB family protein [Halalkalibacterium halodurans]MED3645937.1 MgtC/SapB family protein [Halalkalibacterium halodurans]MED4081164.1 MgtC/SapB family protein [Halalkalibacterium halodurans]MED4084407.1 MgtC/SapB family protein [Halalkalibacterium halodurans]